MIFFKNYSCFCARWLIFTSTPFLHSNGLLLLFISTEPKKYSDDNDRLHAFLLTLQRHAVWVWALFFFCFLMLLLFVRTHVFVDRSKILIQIQQSIHHHLGQSAGEPLRTNSARLMFRRRLMMINGDRWGLPAIGDPNPMVTNFQGKNIHEMYELFAQTRLGFKVLGKMVLEFNSRTSLTDPCHPKVR